MGHASFLIGPTSGGPYDGLLDAIERLRDTSKRFSYRFQRNERKHANDASVEAFWCFDYIIGELMRLRDERKKVGTYAGTPFLHAMNANASMLLEPFSSAQRADLMRLGAGGGRFPSGSAPSPISLARTLNKIKHRHPIDANFRLEQGRHIFLVCPLEPDGCVEFDVDEFCDACVAAVSSM